MFVLIQTFFFIAARFGKTTSSLPLPSNKIVEAVVFLPSD
jgi:hypothetical protein